MAAMINPDGREIHERAPQLNDNRNLPGRRLVGGLVAAAKAGCSYRHWLRLCDAGKAPPGMKLGALRRWDLSELDAWIAAGCPSMREFHTGGAR